MHASGKLRFALILMMLALPAGCGAAVTSPAAQAPATATQAPAGTGTTASGKSFDISFYTGANTRHAWIHVPTGYSSAVAAPLVVNLHGAGSNGKEQETLSGMSVLADREVFLVAYPNGLDQHWDDEAGTPSAADRKFIADVVSKLETDYKIDSSRVYATGMSNGGGMANRVGCDMARVFAAIATVEGGYIDWEDCHPTRPVSVMAFHGVTDPVVPYGGGQGHGPAASGSFPPILDWAAGWASRDLCPPYQVTHPNADVARKEWAPCKSGAAVVLFSIEHQGHSWPGSTLHPAITSQAIDASAEMWTFFRTHPMP